MVPAVGSPRRYRGLLLACDCRLSDGREGRRSRDRGDDVMYARDGEIEGVMGVKDGGW